MREQIDLAIRQGAEHRRDIDMRRVMPKLCVPIAGDDFLRQNCGKGPAELLTTSRTISNALHPDEWSEAHGLQPPRTSNMIEPSSAELAADSGRGQKTKMTRGQQK